jgi:hypothetical protein
VIKLVVPESPAAQGSPAKEQQQQEEHNNISNENKDDEEHPPPSNTRVERMYQDADEVEFKAITNIFFGSRVLYNTRGQHSEYLAVTLWLTLPGRPSLRGSVATRASYRTLSTTSYLIGRRTSSRPLG